MVSYALNKNINVFCEKPFSLDVTEAKLLAKKATELKLINQAGYHNRFVWTFNEVKKLLTSGAIGELYHFIGESYGPVVVKEKVTSWRTKKGEGGGCLYDYASHTIDLISYILGKPVKVSGTQLKSIYSTEVEDAVYSNLTLQNGLSGQLSVNWSDDTNPFSGRPKVPGHDGDVAVPDHLGQRHGHSRRFVVRRRSSRFTFVRYVQASIDSLLLRDITTGLVKSVMFGVTITAVGCLEGLSTGAGAEQVGRSTTQAVVKSIFLVVVVDLFFTVLFFFAGN